MHDIISDIIDWDQANKTYRPVRASRANGTSSG